MCIPVCVCFFSFLSSLFLKRKRQKGMGFCEWDDRECLKGIGGVENILRIYCIEKNQEDEGIFLAEVLSSQMVLVGVPS